jgi:hypothetical protein
MEKNINRLAVEVMRKRYNKAIGMTCSIHGKKPDIKTPFDTATGNFTLSYCCEAFAEQAEQAALE